MNKEEQEVINLLKDILNPASCLISDDIGEKDISILLSLIEKQQQKIDAYNKLLEFKKYKRENHTMDYKKTNKNNKFHANGICQDMRAWKRKGEIKYRAYITFQYKQINLGTYYTLEEAKEARKKGEEYIAKIKEEFKKGGKK